MRRPRCRHLARKIALVLISCIVLQTLIFQEKFEVHAGKSASRSGIVGTSRISGKSFNEKQGSTNSESDTRNNIGRSSVNNSGLTPTERLRQTLMRGYDSSMRPVLDHKKSVHVQVDLTYRQVLDLDEKNQILKSLIWFRQHWKDEHFIWDPEDYDGVKNINIPSSSVWRPDIAVYEEVGTRDFSPRLPFIRLSYDGAIFYAEPTILETTCRVDTAFFPFDSQLCSITFVSWTQPVTNVDLSSLHDSNHINQDANFHFIDSGEWVLTNLGVKKQIGLYDTSDQGKDGKESDKEVKVQFQANRGFLGVKFTLVIRRNSSLYMQSMLFPSFLLTTVALLGFYLPPDSGERVGLQITILLTFMVFLLTVGEMFPASTGPYLGVYFVLCMAQLGVNIFMTVVVLHLHFKPYIDPRTSQMLKNSDSPFFEDASNQDSVIPKPLRRFLQFCNRYITVADADALWMLPIKKDTMETSSENHFDIVESKPMLNSGNSNKCTDEDEDMKRRSNCTTLLCSLTGEDTLTPKHINERWSDPNPKSTGAAPILDSPLSVSVQIISSRDSSKCSTIIQEKDLQNSEQMEIIETDNTVDKTTPTEQNSKNGDLKKVLRNRNKNSNSKQNDSIIRSSGDVNASDRSKKDIKQLMKSFKLNVREIVKDEIGDKVETPDSEYDLEKKKEEAQEEWKSVARAIDRLFFRFYLCLMLFCHVVLFAVAIHTHLNSEWDVD